MSKWQAHFVGGRSAAHVLTWGWGSKDWGFWCVIWFRGLGCRGLGFRGLGFRGLGCRGLGFRGLGFRGLGFRGLGFRGLGL